MQEELKQFGLSENEITVYVSLIKAGTSTANRIAELSGLKRSTTYDNLSLLINKGIVSLSVRDNVNYYEAAEPQKLVDLLEESKERLQKIIPKLESLKGSVTERTGVTFFEGKKGVLTVLNDIIAERKPLWFYGSRKKALLALQHYPENFLQKRAEHGIHLKAVLAEEDKGDSSYNSPKIMKLSEIKFSKALNRITTNVFIYSDRVAFMTSTENPVGIIVRNKEVVEQQKTIFTIFWDLALK